MAERNSSTTRPQPGIVHVAIAQIDPDRRSWHRKYGDPAAAERLRAAIRASRTIEQPVLLRPNTSGSGVPYEIVFGRGRLKAARAEGLTKIPARIQSVSDAEAIKLAAQENGTHAGKGRILERAWRANNYRAAVSPNGEVLDKDLGADLGEDPSEISELLQFAEAVPEDKVAALAKQKGVALEDIVRITRAALRAIAKLPSATQREQAVNRFVRHLAKSGEPHEASAVVTRACKHGTAGAAGQTSNHNGQGKASQEHTVASANGSSSDAEPEHAASKGGPVSDSDLLKFAARIRGADLDALNDEEVLLFVSRFGPTFRILEQRYRDVLERLLRDSRASQVRQANFFSRWFLRIAQSVWGW